jgi:hypothetical protein
MAMTPKDAERIRALEVTVDSLVAELHKLNTVLTSLVAFKHKGIGAFWLASALVGTGIVGTVSMLLNWIRHG